MTTQSESGAMLENLGTVSRFLHQQTKLWKPSSERSMVLDFAVGQLYHYRPLPDAPIRAKSALPPLLIIYAMVNRPFILDLHPESSTVRGLLEQGIDVYLLEWKAPELSHGQLSLNDYLHQSIDRCVNFLRQTVTDGGSVDLMGICQGGFFALCYSAMFPEKVRALVTTVTPVDFHTAEDTLSLWVRYLDLDSLCQQGMNLSGALLAQFFLMLKPMTLSIQKYLDIMDTVRDEESDSGKQTAERFMAMEQWIADSPDQPGRLFKEFVQQCYQQNALCNGHLMLSGSPVNLEKLSMPVFNIYANHDHLVPPDSSKALGSIVDPALYEALAVETGHIGLFVGSRSLRQVPKAISEFLSQV